jgi:hypothetical protein
MNHLISVSLNPCSHHVVWSKEEFLAKMSKLFDESMKNNCTYFNVVIQTDADASHPKAVD